MLFKTPCACGFGSERNKKASPLLNLDGLISDRETFVLKGTFATCTRCILSRWEVCDCHHIKMKKSNLFAYRIILCLVSLALPLYAKSLGKTLAILPKRLLRKWTVHSVIIYSMNFKMEIDPFHSVCGLLKIRFSISFFFFLSPDISFWSNKQSLLCWRDAPFYDSLTLEAALKGSFLLILLLVLDLLCCYNSWRFIQWFSWVFLVMRVVLNVCV